MKSRDITGMRFGRRVVVKLHGTKIYPGGAAKRMWVVKCDCGKVDVEQGSNLTSGRANSCGCAVPDAIRSLKTKHGFTRNRKPHPMYASWANMISRCTNPNTPSSKDYHFRGIKFCSRWRVFSNFLKDMGESWMPGLTLERINNDKGYSPSNCKWATRSEQNNNKRNSRIIDIGGRKQTLSQWSKEIGMCPSKLRYRIKHWGKDAALAEKL